MTTNAAQSQTQPQQVQQQQQELPEVTISRLNFMLEHLKDLFTEATVRLVQVSADRSLAEAGYKAHIEALNKELAELRDEGRDKSN